MVGRRVVAVVHRRRWACRLGTALGLALLGSCHHRSSPRVVVWCVQKSLNVGLKERVEEFGDAVLVGELLATLESDPHALEVHGTYFDHDALLFVLENAIALSSGHAADIEQLCTVDHVVVVSSSYTDALCVHLEAQGAFILPQRRSDAMSASHGKLGTVLRSRRIPRRAHGARCVEVVGLSTHANGVASLRHHRCRVMARVALVSSARVVTHSRHHSGHTG